MIIITLTIIYYNIKRKWTLKIYKIQKNQVPNYTKKITSLSRSHKSISSILHRARIFKTSHKNLRFDFLESLVYWRGILTFYDILQK